MENVGRTIVVASLALFLFLLLPALPTHAVLGTFPFMLCPALPCSKPVNRRSPFGWMRSGRRWACISNRNILHQTSPRASKHWTEYGWPLVKEITGQQKLRWACSSRCLRNRRKALMRRRICPSLHVAGDAGRGVRDDLSPSESLSDRNFRSLVRPEPREWGY